MAKQTAELTPLGVWRLHRTGCEACLTVHVQRTATLANCCYQGAQLLREALSYAHTVRRAGENAPKSRQEELKVAREKGAI